MLALVSSAYFLATLALGLTVLTGSLWEARADIARALGVTPRAKPYRPFTPRVTVKRQVRMVPETAPAWRAAA